jgi:VWFA-related protein
VRAGAAVLLLMAGAAPGQQQGALIRTEARTVLVDAVVTDKKGAYIRDLAARDFHILQDNKEQIITSFALETPTSTAQLHSLVLFFDEASMEAADQLPARAAASGFIDAESRPNRRMAVVSYDGALRVRQNFTGSAGRLKEALPVPRPRTARPLISGSLDDANSQNFLMTLRGLGESLGVLPGRKVVVVFAGKWRNSSVTQSALREAIEACNRSGVAVYPVDVRPVSGQSDALPPGFDPLSTGIRPINGGLQGDAGDSTSGADSASASQQLLIELADRTGGFVVKNSNYLLRGLQAIAIEQDQYYTLTYTPTDAKEGSCHALRVKVDRGGATVRARNAYCMAKPQDLLAGTSAAKNLERRAAETQSGSIAASMQLPYFYSAPSLARVHATMEIATSAVKFDNRSGKLHAEIDLVGIASAGDGDVRARFSDTLSFDFDNQTQIAAWKAKPLHYEKEFRIVPGQYQFTIAFGQPQQGDATFGRLNAPLTIGPWVKGDLGVSGVVLSKEIHPAADTGLLLSNGDQTPLIADATQVVPSGSARFAKSEPGYFYFEVYDPDSSPVSVSVRALNARNGELAWKTGPDSLGIPADAAARAVPILAKLPLDTLAPGSWRLEIEARDMKGKAVERSIDLEIRDGP